MQETIINAHLSDKEVALLQQLNENTPLIEAIRKVMLVAIQSNGVAKANLVYNPMYNWAIQIAQSKLNNEQTGEAIKVVSEGLTGIQLAIEEILHFKVKQETPKKENPAI